MSQLCEKCRLIFRGHWIPKLSSSEEDAESPASSNDFYEQPDWVQCVDSLGALAQESSARPYESPIHHDLRSLKSSAVDGCRLCSMLLDAVPETHDGHQASDPELWQIFRRHPERFRGVVVVRPYGGDQNEDTDLMLEVSYFLDARYDNVSAYFFTVDLDLRPAGKLQPSTNLSGKTAADLRDSTCLHLKKWIEDCTDHHSDCRILQRCLQESQEDSCFLPTRLVGITRKLNSTLSLRLHETKTFREKNIRYVTLSHCWGSTLHTRLKAENYNDFLELIPLAALSKTFLDAAHTTNRLSFQYLWIDALCIIRDSPSDWVTEALLMASVYSNSSVNLAATFSVDGSGGLFPQDSNVLPANPCLVEATWEGFQPDTFLVHDDGRWNRRIEEARLNKRAWVLQERLLAPRTVHFARDQLWWECSRLRACEAWPYGVPEDRSSIYSDAVSALRQLFDDAIAADDASAKQTDGEDASGESFWQHGASWLKIVRTYSTCGLTKPSDKLVAISGIAKAFQALSLGSSVPRMESKDNSGDDNNAAYVAGHWRSTFPATLLWSTRSSGSRPAEYRAPTWSWASVDGEIYCAAGSTDGNYADIEKYAVRISEICIATTSLDPFGPVRGGSDSNYIRLVGPLYPAALMDADMSDPEDPRMARLIVNGVDFVHDETFIEALDDDEWYSLLSREQREGIERELLLLRVFTTASSEHVNGKFVSEGLVLEPVLAKEDTGMVGTGNFRRIGWVRLFHEDAEDSFHERLLAGGVPLRQSYYKTDCGNQFYEISII